MLSVHALESPRSIQTTHIFMTKLDTFPKISLNIYFLTIERISCGLKKEFESTIINETSVFQSLKLTVLNHTNAFCLNVSFYHIRSSKMWT